jgi:hypothetical protein
MAMTTCKECRQAVADEAPACPNCGVTAPGEGGVERDAARKADTDAFEKKLWLGCGGFILLIVLLIGGGAAWNAITEVELDRAAERACSAVTTAQYGDGAIRQGAGRVQAVAYAKESTVEELRQLVGDGPLDPDTVSDDYFKVATWCNENA